MKKQKTDFVTIDEYLAEDESLGEKAETGEINYGLYRWQNPTHILNLLINTDKNFKHVCLPAHNFDYFGFANIRSAIMVNWAQGTLMVDFEYLDEKINECIENGKIRFLILELMIDGGPIGHSNKIIIDLDEKEIERFEPFGVYGEKMVENLIYVRTTHSVDDIIDDAMKIILDKTAGVKGFSYVSPRSILPKTDIFIQKKPDWAGGTGIMDAFKGLCVTISTMYVFLRLLNPQHDRESVYKYLTNQKPEILLNMMLRFARYIEETLKREKHTVEKLKKKVVKDLVWKDKNYITIPITSKSSYNIRNNMLKLFTKSSKRDELERRTKQKSFSRKRKKRISRKR